MENIKNRQIGLQRENKAEEEHFRAILPFVPLKWWTVGTNDVSCLTEDAQEVWDQLKPTLDTNVIIKHTQSHCSHCYSPEKHKRKDKSTPSQVYHAICRHYPDDQECKVVSLSELNRRSGGRHIGKGKYTNFGCAFCHRRRIKITPGYSLTHEDGTRKYLLGPEEVKALNHLSRVIMGYDDNVTEVGAEDALALINIFVHWQRPMPNTVSFKEYIVKPTTSV